MTLALKRVILIVAPVLFAAIFVLALIYVKRTIAWFRKFASNRIRLAVLLYRIWRLEKSRGSACVQ